MKKKDWFWKFFEASRRNATGIFCEEPKKSSRFTPCQDSSISRWLMENKIQVIKSQKPIFLSRKQNDETKQIRENKQ